jgi:hypothetical protein
MALREGELARRESGAVECRGEAVRLHWTFDELPTSDSHTLDVKFSCSIRIADNPTDRRMFVEVFLNAADVVTFQTIADHFSASLRAEATRLAAAHSADGAVSGMLNDEYIASLSRAAKPVAFASGLEVLPPFQLGLSSRSLQRSRLHDVAEARAKEQSTRQLQHMQHAGDVLRQFQALRQSAPDLPAGRLLQQLDPAERGSTLRTLLLASASEKSLATLYAVAGPYLIRIDPRQAPPRPVLIELPRELGPLRSVQPATLDGASVLLIGARGGVMLVAAQDPTNVRSYALPELQSPLGFNSVAVAGRSIWASHSEAGIVRWSLDDPAAAPAAETLAAARQVRALDESRVIYAAGNAVSVHDGTHALPLPAASPAEVIAILPVQRSVIVVHADGVIATIDPAAMTVQDVRRRNTPLDAAGLLPWLGDVRLLLATESGPIDCIGLDDPLVTQYLSPYRGIKMVEACTDLIAAVTPDRQRIVVWHTWDEQRPLGDIHVTSAARHRIGDISFMG